MRERVCRNASLESCKLHDAEERVKELTEENAKLKHFDLEAARSEADIYKSLYKRQGEENERLRAENAKYEAENHAEFNKWLKLEEATKRYYAELFEEAKIAVKEDAVRKMQERFKTRIRGIYLDENEASAIIDEVAENLLNKTEEEKK